MEWYELWLGINVCALPLLIMPIMLPENWTEVFIFPLVERLLCENGIPMLWRIVCKIVIATVLLPLLVVYYVGLLITAIVLYIWVWRLDTKMNKKNEKK
jgi:hypothetical protein